MAVELVAVCLAASALAGEAVLSVFGIVNRDRPGPYRYEKPPHRKASLRRADWW
jgi:hypothetical protein